MVSRDKAPVRTRGRPTVLKLRPYQARVINQIIRKLNSPDAAALFVGPTGCGKTEIITALIERLPRRARTIVIQDRVDLVRQVGTCIAKYLPDRKVVAMAASLPTAKSHPSQLPWCFWPS